VKNVAVREQFQHLIQLVILMVVVVVLRVRENVVLGDIEEEFIPVTEADGVDGDIVFIA
jgi:hypothetical protein